MLDVSEKDGTVILAVHAVPRASRSEIVGEMDGALKVKIAAPPVGGAANAELVKFFAKKLAVAKADVEIVSGRASRVKLVRVTGVTARQVRDAIG